MTKKTGAISYLELEIERAQREGDLRATLAMLANLRVRLLMDYGVPPELVDDEMERVLAAVFKDRERLNS
jgi:hypothetical protein